MSPTTTITNSTAFWGIRGGVGTTTTAILFMRHMLDKNPDMRVTITDFARNGGFAPLLGLSGDGALCWETVTSQARGIVPTTHSVADCGIYDEDESRPEVFTKNYLVLRGPDYIGMRAAGLMRDSIREKFDGIIVVQEQGRAMDCEDVRSIMEMPVTSLRWDVGIARASDAGLLTMRPKTPGFDL